MAFAMGFIHSTNKKFENFPPNTSVRCSAKAAIGTTRQICPQCNGQQSLSRWLELMTAFGCSEAAFYGRLVPKGIFGPNASQMTAVKCQAAQEPCRFFDSTWYYMKWL